MHPVRLLLILMLFASCSGRNGNFSVTCQVTEPGDGSGTMYLSRRTLSGSEAVDSALADKSGVFRLEGYTEKPDFFILYVKPQQYINLIIHPGDRINVIAQSSSFDYRYIVEGSKDSRLVQELVAKQAGTLQKITEISTVYENSIGSPGFDSIKARIDRQYDSIVSDHYSYSVDMITNNPSSLASLMALYQQLGRNIPVFDYKEDLAYYELVDSALSGLYPSSEAVRDLNRKVNEIRESLVLEPGSPAPDINLPDKDGKPVALSSLKGKPVLLCFWASWSPLSLEQNRLLRSSYGRHSRDGLEYYQVSLDRTRESWLASLEREQPAGIQVSDLQYWDSPVVETYRVDKLPLYYLIDREGRIAGKISDAAEAENMISAYLSD